MVPLPYGLADCLCKITGYLRWATNAGQKFKTIEPPVYHSFDCRRRLYLWYAQVNVFLAVIAIGDLGITLVVPIGGADMPVVVSLLNSYSGIAVAMTGFVLTNNVHIIVGSAVGALVLSLQKSCAKP